MAQSLVLAAVSLFLVMVGIGAWLRLRSRRAMSREELSGKTRQRIRALEWSEYALGLIVVYGTIAGPRDTWGWEIVILTCVTLGLVCILEVEDLRRVRRAQ